MHDPDDLMSLVNQDVPPLDPAFAERVRAVARQELAPDSAGSGSQTWAHLRLALSGAVVPALLVSAAGVRIAQTVHVAKTVFTDEGESGGS